MDAWTAGNVTACLKCGSTALAESLVRGPREQHDGDTVCFSPARPREHGSRFWRPGPLTDEGARRRQSKLGVLSTCQMIVAGIGPNV